MSAQIDLPAIGSIWENRKGDVRIKVQIHWTYADKPPDIGYTYITRPGKHPSGRGAYMSVDNFYSSWKSSTTLWDRLNQEDA